MDRRTLIFLALSFTLLGFYPMVLQHFYPDYYKKASRTAGKKSVEVSHAAAVTGDALKVPPPGAVVPSGKFSSESDQTFQNSAFELIFNRTGGAIHEVSFLKFMEIYLNFSL